MQAELFLKLLALSPYSLEQSRSSLFINAQPLAKFSEDLDCYQPKRGLYLNLKKLTKNVFAEIPDKKYDLIFIYPSASAAENYAYFAKSLELLNPGGICLSAGDNNFGAKRFEDKLKTLFNNINSESKYKSRIFWAKKTAEYNPDLFKQWLELLKPQRINESELLSQAGLFSEGKHDEASVLLAPFLTELSGNVVDLGSGNGYLSYQALKQNKEISSIHLAEHDYRALELSKLALNGIEGPSKNFHWWDISEETLPAADYVFSNPPYHKGFELDLKLLQDFINYAFKILKRRGKFIFVTQQTFKVEANELIFRNAEMLCRNNRYKIYQITK